MKSAGHSVHKESAVRKWPVFQLFHTLFAIDLRTLAFFRICLASAALLNIFNLYYYGGIGDFFTDDGVVPREFVGRGLWNISILMLSGTVQGQNILFSLGAIAAFFLLIGCHTRLAAFLTWFFAISVLQRNPYIASGGDLLLNMMSFWAMFVPLGARWSWDSLRSKPHASSRGKVLSLGTAALTIQMPLVYFAAGLLKNSNEWTVNFTALFYALHLHMFATHLALYVRELPHPVLQGMTIGVLALELAGPILLFSPVYTERIRLGLVTLFLMLHAGIFFLLWVGLFSAMSILAIAPLIPGLAWDLIAKLNIQDRLGLRSLNSYLERKVVKKRQPVGLPSSWLGTLICGAALFLCLLDWYYEINDSPRSRMAVAHQSEYLPREFRYLITQGQKWGMFTQTAKPNFWFVSIGVLADGSEVNLLSARGPIPDTLEPASWEGPQLGVDTLYTGRWLKLFENLNGGWFDSRRLYRLYFCRAWGERFTADKQLIEMRLYSVLQQYSLKGKLLAPLRSVIVEGFCADLNYDR